MAGVAKTKTASPASLGRLAKSSQPPAVEFAPRKPQKSKRVRKLAKKSARKAKEAGQFLYDHRKQILEAVELLGSVIAIVSTIMGKSGFRRKSKK